MTDRFSDIQSDPDDYNASSISARTKQPLPTADEAALKELLDEPIKEDENGEDHGEEIERDHGEEIEEDHGQA